MNEIPCKKKRTNGFIMEGVGGFYTTMDKAINSAIIHNNEVRRGVRRGIVKYIYMRSLEIRCARIRYNYRKHYWYSDLTKEYNDMVERSMAKYMQEPDTRVKNIPLFDNDIQSK